MTNGQPSRKISILLAVGVTLAFVIWMLSGIGNDPVVSERAVGSSSVRDAGAERPMSVMIQRSAAREIEREIAVSGRTEPNRSVELGAETEGRIVELGAERGSAVSTGQLIARLDMRDRAARLAEAEALIVQMRLQYEAAQRLQGQQFVSEAQIAEAEARLVSAEAARERILLDIDHTTIEAPFDALVQDRAVELGDYVKAGDTVALIVDTDPMIVVGDVNEREVANLAIGSPGVAEMGNGREYPGTVRYLAPVANESTRTFRVELSIPNPDLEMRAGMTTSLRLGAGRMTAHSISPALLALADDGRIGVKAVDDFNRVRFYPVEIVGSSDAGALVTGLPDILNIISVGQGFVTEGQEVIPVEDPAALSQTEYERPH